MIDLTSPSARENFRDVTEHDRVLSFDNKKTHPQSRAEVF